MSTKRLWIFDFDGTISGLVEDRRKARLDPDCAGMLENLQKAPQIKGYMDIPKLIESIERYDDDQASIAA